jgi:hypothetical protein
VGQIQTNYFIVWSLLNCYQVQRNVGSHFLPRRHRPEFLWPYSEPRVQSYMGQCQDRVIYCFPQVRIQTRLQFSVPNSPFREEFFVIILRCIPEYEDLFCFRLSTNRGFPVESSKIYTGLYYWAYVPSVLAKIKTYQLEVSLYLPMLPQNISWSVE